MLVGHVPKEGEDHKPGEETGQTVDGAGDDGVSESIKSNEMKQISHQLTTQSISA